MTGHQPDVTPFVTVTWALLRVHTECYVLAHCTVRQHVQKEGEIWKSEWNSDKLHLPPSLHPPRRRTCVLIMERGWSLVLCGCYWVVIQKHPCHTWEGGFGRESWGALTRASTPVYLVPLPPCHLPLLFCLQSVVTDLGAERDSSKTKYKL